MQTIYLLKKKPKIFYVFGQKLCLYHVSKFAQPWGRGQGLVGTVFVVSWARRVSWVIQVETKSYQQIGSLHWKGSLGSAQWQSVLCVCCKYMLILIDYLAQMPALACSVVSSEVDCQLLFQGSTAKRTTWWDRQMWLMPLPGVCDTLAKCSLTFGECVTTWHVTCNT